eukprot:1591720-Lingulodinium_polyedra.AAC.1
MTVQVVWFGVAGEEVDNVAAARERRPQGCAISGRFGRGFQPAEGRPFSTVEFPLLRARGDLPKRLRRA